jgi:hypothetical protein
MEVAKEEWHWHTSWRKNMTTIKRNWQQDRKSDCFWNIIYARAKGYVPRKGWRFVMSAEHLMPIIRTCKKCGCFVDAKTKLMSSSLFLCGKWSSEKEG